MKPLSAKVCICSFESGIRVPPDLHMDNYPIIYILCVQFSSGFPVVPENHP
jgi:hypothetical protein